MKISTTLLVLSVISGIAFSTDDCHVSPIYREECGWAGILAETCESKGCCFDSSIHGGKWCFKKRNSQCEVLPNYRYDCGWPGISQKTCETRGCCFNPYTPGTIRCFAKMKRENIDDVCHVPPIYREECGSVGISAEMCKSLRCCFDSSIPGAKLCFKKANRYFQIMNEDAMEFPPEKRVKLKAAVSIPTHREQNGVSKQKRTLMKLKLKKEMEKKKGEAD